MISTMSKSNLLYFIKKVNQEVDRLNLKFQRVQMRAQINIYKILSLIYPLNHLPPQERRAEALFKVCLNIFLGDHILK